jgi:hypothetical protein
MANSAYRWILQQVHLFRKPACLPPVLFYMSSIPKYFKSFNLVWERANSVVATLRDAENLI